MRGWRASFVVFGMLGFVCGGIVLRWLPDPERGVPDALHDVESHSPRSTAAPLSQRLRAVRRGRHAHNLAAPTRSAQLIRIRTAWVMVLAASIGEFVFSGLGAWAISFFRRYHGFSAAGAGAVQGAILVGVIGGTSSGAAGATGCSPQNRHEDRVLLGAGFFMLGWCSSRSPPSPPTRRGSPSCLMSSPRFAIYVPIPGLWAMWFDIIPAPLRGRASSLFTIVRVGFTASAPALIGAISTPRRCEPRFSW